MFIINICFVILFLLFPVFALVLLRTAGFSVFKLSMPSFTIAMLFAFAYIGILPLYFRWDTYRDSIGINDKIILLRIFLYISISIIGIIIGFCLAHNILKGNDNISIIEVSKRLNILDKFALFFLLILCTAVLFLYIRQVENIALLKIISGVSRSAAEERSSMTNAFSKAHRYSVFMNDLLRIVTFSLFAFFIKRKRNFFIIILFIISFFLATFSQLMSTQKAPIAWLLIGYWFVYIMVKKKGIVPVKNIILMVIFILVILSLTYIFFMGQENIHTVLRQVISRTFTGQIMPAYFYLEYFPAYHDYLMGLSFPNPGGLLPYKPYRLTVEIMNWKFPGLAASGIVGSAPTAFWGEMYANFGVIGVCVPPVLIGIFLYFIHYVFSKLPQSPINIGFYVWIIMHYKNLSGTGLSSFVNDFYFFVILIIYCMTVFFVGGGKIKLDNEKYRKFICYFKNSICK